MAIKPMRELLGKPSEIEKRFAQTEARLFSNFDSPSEIPSPASVGGWSSSQGSEAVKTQQEMQQWAKANGIDLQHRYV